MKAMKIGVVLIAAALTQSAAAATMYTNEVNGIEWVYTLSGGKATLGGGSSSTPALVGNPSGSVKIPSVLGETPVVAIASDAFSGKSGIKDLSVPSSVTNIGSCAFQNCSAVTNIIVSDSVQSIGYGAFAGCVSLESLTIPFVGSRRGSANGSGDNFGYVFGSYISAGSGSKSVTQHYYSGNSVYNTSYYIPNSLTSVVIVDETLVRPYAFENCTMLTNIVVNPAVSGIGPYAFSGCSGLRSFVVPDAAKWIDGYAFSGCSTLTELVVPANVNAIGSYAFQNCANLASIRILSDYVAIDQYAFYGCPASIFDTTSVSGLKLMDGYVVGTESTLSGVVDISAMRGVMANAFSGNTKITRVVLPEGMTLIPAGAFSGCSSMTSITIPDTVRSIGSSAFSGCSSLTGITLPDAVTSIGDYAFNGCRNLTSIILPENVQSVGYYAFASCTSLRSVTIPTTLKTIGTSAFSGDSNLVTVNIRDLTAWCKIIFSDAYSNPVFYSHALTLNGEVIHDLAIPDGLSRLHDYAFYNNYALTSVAVPGGIAEIPRYAFYRCGGITNAVLPESVANIGSCAFQGCTNLTAFPFPTAVTNIAVYAFAECSGLAALELPSGLRTIGDYSFQKCHGISDVEIPQSVVSVGQYAFNTCTNLANVTVHNGLTSIGNSAFSGCARLTVSLADDVGTIPSNLFRYCGGIYDVEFSGSVTNIASSAFYGCSLITRLNLPDSLKRIADYAFYGCTALGGVVIPEGVTSIGQYAFGNCTKLTRAVIPSTVKSVGQYAFSGCSRLASIDLAEGATSVGNYAFQNCTSLTNAVIPATVTTVGENAFNGCTGMKTVSFPDGLTTIGNYAFRNCRSLSALDIPSSVRKIGEYAFEGCNALQNLSIPDGVVTIGNHAFYACTNLVSLSVPASATNIGWYAFAACSNLTQVTLLTTPSRVIPTTDLAMEGSDWSVVDGDTIRADSPKLFSQMAQEAIGQGVLSFEWRTPGYWYRWNNQDYFSTYGYFNLSVDYWYSEYSSGSYYSGSCDSETWSTVAISTSSSNRHTLDWDFYWVPDGMLSEGIDPSVGFGSIRSLSFVPTRASGNSGVDGTVVGASAFEGCVKLERVDIEDVGAWCGTIFENAWANPLRYAGKLFVGGLEVRNLVIPDTANAVSGWAFADCGGITNIVFPEGIASIGTHAFQNTAIEDIALPSSVTNVGTFAFAGCDGVKSISIPVGLRKINDFAFSGQTKVTSATLPSCTALSKFLPDSLSTIRTITIADGETEIVDDAFAGCTALESIRIPDTVQKIGQNAFRDCTHLTSVLIPSTANVVWYNAFDGCLRLHEIVVGDGNASYSSEDGVLFDNRSQARLLTRCPEAIATKDYSIPDGVGRVGGYSFQDCAGIENVAIPASVTNIGTRAFRNCSSLTAFEVADENPAYKSIDGVLFTKDGRTLLRFPPAKSGHYDIPDGVETIAMYAFEGCGRLSSLLFGADVKYIESRAFDGCTFLAQAVLNDGLKRIDDYAFNGCTSLAALTIPESVTSLGEGVFDSCDQLESLSVPENIAVKPKGIGGCVRGNVSLYRGCIYNVTNELIVTGGATLKIPSGVVLKMHDWHSIIVLKGGRLVTSGTRAAPVVITSYSDDEFGGDTNGDGNATSPQGGDWGGIRILGEAELAYTRIRYGQQAYYGPGVISVSDYQYYDDYYYWDFDAEWMDFANYYDDDARLTMDGCVVEHSTVDSWTVGVSNEGGSVVARNCVFFDLPSGVAGYAQYSGNSYTMADQTNHFVNCVFHGCNSIVMDDWYNVDSTAAVFDNCVFSEMVEWVGGYGESIPSDLAFRNCCFWNPEDDEFYPIQTNALIGVAGNVWGNPRFENANVGDFHIKAGSACIDAGREDLAPARDYFGQPRNGAPDIGIHEVQLRPVNDVDLAALAISGDAEASIGGTITVMWTVGNVSTTNIVDEWRDIIELVDSTGRSVELGRRTVMGGLNAGANLSFSATFPVPSMSPGTARLRLKVNPYRDIYEGTLTANNVCLSEATVEIVLPAYDPVANSSFELRAGGSVALRVPAGSGTTAFKLTGSGNASIAAYALAGGVPAGLRYDVAAVPLADGSLLLVLPKNAAETDYNIAVFNDGTSSATVSMESVTESVSILEVAPARLANTGEGHLTIIGTGMDRVSAVRLQGARTIEATKFRADSSANLSATFDLSGATVGGYSVVLVDEDGATYRTGKTVEVYNPKIGPKLEAWLELPSATRQGRIYTGRICYRNSGDEDMLSPCLSLTVANALIGLISDELSFTKFDVLAIGAISPYGILKTGEENHIDFVFKSGAQPQFSLTHLNGATETWRLSESAMSDAATVLNSRGRRVVSLETLQPYFEAIVNGDENRAAICGHVVVSGTATSAITVTAETKDGETVATDEVDENGVFVLDGLANSTNYVVKVAGGAVADAVSVGMPSTGDYTGLMIMATATRRLLVSVEGVPDGESVCGVFAFSVGIDGEVVHCELTNKTTVAYASTNIYDVIYYTATLDSGRVDSGCFVVSPFDDQVGEEATIDFTDAIVVRGRLLDNDGMPLSDGVVRIRAEDFTVLVEGFVADDGTYVIGGLDAGRYVIDAYARGRTSPSATIAIEEGGEDIVCDLTLPDVVGGTIQFEITSNAEERSLVLENCNSDVSDYLVVSNGVFTIANVPSGNYDAYLIDTEGHLVSPVKRLTVDDGDMISESLAENADVSVSGSLLDSAGNGVQGVIVFSPLKGSSYRIETAGDGSFETDVPSGKYWLVCSATDCDIKSCFVELKNNSVLTVRLGEEETINDADPEEEVLDESEVETTSVSGVANVDSGVTVEFLSSDKQILALYDVFSPNGVYTLNNVPVQYAHVWITDSYGRGKLLSKEDFTAEQSRIEIQDAELKTVKVRVFGDNEKTIPLPNVNVFLTGVCSNVISRATDASGVVEFKVTRGQYSIFASRVFVGEGVDTIVNIAGEDSVIEYVLYDAVAASASTWFAKRDDRTGRMMSARLLSTLVVTKSKAHLTLTKGISPNICNFGSGMRDNDVARRLGLLNGYFQHIGKLEHYISAATEMYRDEPSFKCEHNLTIWKRYKIARIKLALRSF
ncbi:MAG: leucine-rich repeat protein [Kiritimatiellae bacterium]|nr:leucine-rich repeat protein [Kiritimatiellia bacterium]